MDSAAPLEERLRLAYGDDLGVNPHGGRRADLRIFRNQDHWHYVSWQTSPLEFALSYRLPYYRIVGERGGTRKLDLAEAREQPPPPWAEIFLAQLAEHAIATSSPFEAGQVFPWEEVFPQEDPQAFGSLLFFLDPVLGQSTGFSFLQFLFIGVHECEFVKQAGYHSFLQAYGKRHPLLVDDSGRDQLQLRE